MLMVMFDSFRRWTGLAVKNTKPQTHAASSTIKADAKVTAGNSPLTVSLDELLQLRVSVKGVKLKAINAARAPLAGGHVSRFRGRGMDYQESRNYQPGDDVRNMDWRVTARVGKPHVKVYEEERERPVILLVDAGPSMFFATQGRLKSVQAARAAAFLAWATVAQGDRVGGLLFNGHHVEIQPRRGNRAALHMCKALVEETEPEKGLTGEAKPDSLATALKRLRRVARPGSLVFVLSDFYTLDDEAIKQLRRLQLHNDVVGIQFSDELERHMPPPGRYLITDGRETAPLQLFSPAAQQLYQQWIDQHQNELHKTFRRNGIPLLELSTGDDVPTALRGWFGANRVLPRSSLLNEAVEVNYA